MNTITGIADIISIVLWMIVIILSIRVIAGALRDWLRKVMRKGATS